MSTPRFVAIPAVLFAVGLGMAMWYGKALYELPTYTEAEVQQSADLNLAMDFQRSGKPLPQDAAALKALRESLAAEVQASITAERQALQLPLGIGLLAAVFSLGQMILMQRLRRRRP